MTTSRDAGEDLLRILDELDTLIASARSMPMSASAIVHRQDALELIEKARESVPRAVRRAEQIVADADAVLAQGKTKAKRIIPVKTGYGGSSRPASHGTGSIMCKMMAN